MWIGRGRAPLLCGEHLATSSRVTRRVQRLALYLLHLRLQPLDRLKAMCQPPGTIRVRLFEGLDRGGVAFGLGTHARQQLHERVDRRRLVRHPSDARGPEVCGSVWRRMRGCTTSGALRLVPSLLL